MSKPNYWDQNEQNLNMQTAKIPLTQSICITSYADAMKSKQLSQ